MGGGGGSGSRRVILHSRAGCGNRSLLLGAVEQQICFRLADLVLLYTKCSLVVDAPPLFAVLNVGVVVSGVCSIR